jgi:hypothetical protein
MALRYISALSHIGFEFIRLAFQKMLWLTLLSQAGFIFDIEGNHIIL